MTEQTGRFSRRRALRGASFAALAALVTQSVPPRPASAMASAAPADQGDPLPSWNDGHARQAILDFVSAVTAAGTSTFVPPAERIATFDNDGNLWAEQPLYSQGFF